MYLCVPVWKADVDFETDFIPGVQHSDQTGQPPDSLTQPISSISPHVSPWFQTRSFMWALGIRFSCYACPLPSPQPCSFFYFFKVTATMLLDLENQRSATVVVLLVFLYLPWAKNTHLGTSQVFCSVTGLLWQPSYSVRGCGYLGVYLCSSTCY